METFSALESEVRTYSRCFPAVFARATGSELFDEGGRRYLDFFSGAGTLNYGHNNPRLKARLIEYLQADGITHSLDMATAAKRAFLERFEKTILRPRGLRYKVQFVGPTGTNAIEAALKLARKVTRRTNVVFFSNAYHGVTLASLAVTGNAAKRAGAGVPLAHAVPVPYDGYLGDQDSLRYLEAFLDDPSSGLDRPAAIVLETVQAEGGVNVASAEWLRRLAELARRHGILLIIDDVQVGCGRTGTFFSFESAGITPDIVCLSKSISGFGLPMALVLLRPELDQWQPGEHNGTFRGLNLAFITAAEALSYWENDELTREVLRKSELARGRLEAIAARHERLEARVRGRGLILGLDLRVKGLGDKVALEAFHRGLLIEAVGPHDNVLKLLPPLVITDAELLEGLDIIEDALAETLHAGIAQEPATVEA
ncbi:MAG TPA: diaminobutyrate--2-oxoglutarate transaminase [Thermoanaerobaculia bacterium]|nr:diaminobutyrate--2-oxoglutarate transaminase [Thermoanaerobaculia bacterium]